MRGVLLAWLAASGCISAVLWHVDRQRRNMARFVAALARSAEAAAEAARTTAQLAESLRAMIEASRKATSSSD